MMSRTGRTKLSARTMRRRNRLFRVEPGWIKIHRSLNIRSRPRLFLWTVFWVREIVLHVGVYNGVGPGEVKLNKVQFTKKDIIRI